MFRLFTSCLLFLSLFHASAANAETQVCRPLSRSERGYVKSSPGHYIALGAIRKGRDPLPDALKEIRSNPGIVGVQRRYSWSDLQTGPQTFDFRKLRSDIEAVKKENRKLSIFVQWKFRNSEGDSPVPAFLGKLTDKAYTHPLGGKNKGRSAKGFIAALDNPVVTNELIKFFGQLAKEVDDHPSVSSIVFGETAIGVNFDQVGPQERNRISNAFYEQLLRVDHESSCLFKHTPVFQLTNFPAKRLEEMTQDYMRWGVAFGGPDVWLNDSSMKAYDFYPEMAKKGPVGVIVADGNYHWANHDDEVKRDPSRRIPGTPDEIVQRLAKKAQNELKANFIFWKRNGPRDPFYRAVLNYIH
jgi:hypothetical protein